MSYEDAKLGDVLVNIDVDDLDRAVRFYTRALGLKLSRRLSPTVAELRGAPVPIYLTEHSAETTPNRDTSRRRRYERHWTPVHLDFVVDNLDAAIERAEIAGAEREGEVQEFDWGRFAVFADPFGNGFCVLAFTDGGYPNSLRSEVSK